MSSRCALRITEQGEAGPPAFTALLGRGVVAALGEHRCARSRAWGACGAPLRPGFGLICLEHISVHPPLLRKTCTRASRIAVFRPDFDARVHVLGATGAFPHRCAPLAHRCAPRAYLAHRSAPHARTSLALPMRPNAPRSLLHRARAPCASKEWLARAHHIDDVLTTLPLALHCLRNAHAFRSRALRWHNALSPYCDDVPAARGSRRGDIGGGLEAAPFRLAQCGG